MRFQRRFTESGKSPYSEIPFAQRKSEIRNPNGSLVFSVDNAYVPAEWSQVAVDVLAQKYFRKAGLPVKTQKVVEAGIPEWLQCSVADETAMKDLPPEARTTMETDARQVFDRMAGCWTYWGWKHKYFEDEAEALTFFDELCFMLANQMVAPNSPQWFNTGLNWAYGINGPAQGHYYADPTTGEVRLSEDAYTHPQPHACFIQSVGDNLVNEGGIMELWTREARLFKYGSGTGTNFSKIRAAGESLSGGGRSSGLMSFLKIGDRAAGAIKSGGTTRRAAKMVTLDIDHPDIEEYIDWKMVEEQKVAAMVTGSKICRRMLDEILRACWGSDDKLEVNPRENIKLKKALKRAHEALIPKSYIQRILQLAEQGYKKIHFPEYDVDWQSEAYATVSGQNSNNSVRIPNSFMHAVENEQTWDLTSRTSGKAVKTVEAKDLWDKINVAAWNSADPGLQYDTTINEWHTCPAGGRINASNPCSEYMFLDDTACNLASINLIKFLNRETAVFDVKQFEYVCRMWTVVLEISVLMAQFPSREIAEKSYEYRTLGLGYANLGAMLMVCGIPYDSIRACALTGSITAIMTGTCYKTSAELAATLGTFRHYEANKDAMHRVMRNHRRAAYNVDQREYEELEVTPWGINSSHCPQYLHEAAKKVWDDVVRLGKKHGFRNAQVSVIAPTGTIGLVMDCDTTGIEPDFALVKFKKLAGGGHFKIINASVPAALTHLGYTADQVKRITDFSKGTATLVGAPFINHETLKAKGFTEAKIAKVEAALTGAFEIKYAFSRHILGDKFLTQNLQVDPKTLEDWNFELLKFLGFSADQIARANEYCCGTMTLEGAPDLKEEHYAVFDCANKCGPKGKRFISYMGHLNIMAAAQPFLSGAISKTINMPNEGTVEQIKDVYTKAWTMGIKAIALYRDGSKLSQPLSSVLDEVLEEEIEEKEETGDRVAVVAQKLAMAVQVKREREHLPNRRNGYTQKVVVGGHKLFLRTGEYPDGRLGEVFLDMHREGASFRSLMNCFAIAVSLGLQYGVPLDEYVDAFVYTKFEPSGALQGHDQIKFCTSVIDFVFRELGLNYLGRTDFAHVPHPAAESLEATVEKEPAPSLDETDREFSVVMAQTSALIQADTAAHARNKMNMARMKGYEGDACPECGNLTLLRNGTCLKCDTCGSTTGCS